MPTPSARKGRDGDHSHPAKDAVAYLVRSFRTNARIRSLTTGTFNRVVKDRIAVRLSGANSVQANSHECESDCPRNLSTIPSALPAVNARNPQNFHVISTLGIWMADRQSGTSGAKARAILRLYRHDWKSCPSRSWCDQNSTPAHARYNAQRYSLPLQQGADFGAHGFLGPQRGGRQKIEKRT